MKKRFLGVILSLVLVVSSMPLHVMAADQHTHTVEDNNITFTSWSTQDGLPTTAGNYYLDTDVNLSETWTVPSGVTYLDLNGHVIRQTTDKTRVIYVPSNVTLNLCDCDTTTVHYFNKADRSAQWVLTTDVTDHSVIGGCITGGCVENTISSDGQWGGGGIFVEGTLNMYGGSIVGNKVVENNDGKGKNRTVGGGVFVSGGKFNMNGGSVVGNTAVIGNHKHVYGGGIYFYNGSFIMNGGRIAENYSSRFGGGIACHKDKGTPKVIIKDGTIEKNIADFSGGGAFILGEVDFTMSGGVVQNNISHYLGGGLCLAERVSIPAVFTGNAKILNNLAVNNSAVSGGSSDSPGDGGGIGGYKTNISITGNVEISGNKADDYGGGVGLWTYSSNYCSVTVGDSVKITDNYHCCDVTDDVASGGKTGNIWLDTNSEIIIAEGDNAPEDGIRVGVSKANSDKPITKNVVTRGQEKYLFADDSEQSVVFDTATEKLKLDSGHIHDEKNFSKWESSATSLPTSGAYYLSSDVTMSEAWTITAESTVHLDLNGHILNLNGKNITVAAGAQLDVYDCKPEATHEGTTSCGGMITGGYSSGNGGGVYVAGTFNLHNGSLCNNSCTANNCCGGAVYVEAGAVFNMFNGSLYSNTAKKSGGAIANNGGTVNIYDGKIYSNNNQWPNGQTYDTGGAGIWTTNGGTTTISGPVKLYANHSGNGGAMKVVNGTIIFDGAEIGLNTDTVNSAPDNYSGVRNTDSYSSTVTYTSGRYHTLNVYSPAISGTSSITFDKNGGTGGTDSVDNQAWGEDLQTIVVPTRNGYAFLGYFNEDGEQYYNTDGTAVNKPGEANKTLENGYAYYGNGTRWDYVGPVTLYAKWAKETHTHSDDSAAIFEEPISNPSGLQALFENGGSGYLVENIEVSDRFMLLSGDVKLDLNGKNITFTGTSTASAIELQNGCNFDLYDCGYGKILKGDSAGYAQAVNVNANSTFRMHGGTISGFKNNTQYQWGGAVCVNGSMDMSGGTITDCLGYYGGAVAVHGTGSEMHMTGGKIIGNNAESGNGGGVCINGTNAEFLMSGGTVAYNTANSGGGVSVDNGSFVMTGGTITGNTAICNDNVYGGGVCQNGTFTLGGDAQIIGNVIGGEIVKSGDSYTLTGGTVQNVYLPTGRIITIATGSDAPSGASVGVTAQTRPSMDAPVSVTGENSEDYSSCLISDETAYKFASDSNDDNIVKLMLPGTITVTTPETDKDSYHGYITVDRSTAVAGETVNVTVCPNTGYSLKKLVYNDGSDHDITSAGSFTMPSANVSVTAEFEHIHNYTYSADGNTLKAACIAGCPDDFDTTPFTLTLTAPTDLVYSGSAREAGFVNIEKSTWEAAGFEVPSISYTAKTGSELSDDKAVKAGKYTASITVGSATASIEFTIAKALSEVTVAPIAESLTYNGTNLSLVSTGTATGGTMNYAVGDSSTTAPASGWTASVPTGKNAGTYYVWYKCVGDSNHTDSEPGCVIVNISAKEITVSGITASKRGYVAGEKSVILVTANATLAGKADGDSLAVTAAGEMENDSVGVDKKVTISNLTLTGDDKDNYVLSSVGQQTETTVTIDKTYSSVLVQPDSASPVYDGSLKELITTGEAQDGTMSYAIGTDASAAPESGWSALLPTGKNAGTYYVWYKCVGDSNHSDTDPVCVTAAIAKKSITVSGITAVNRIYAEDDKSVDLVTTDVIFDGLAEGDELLITAVGEMEDANVGENKPVIISNIMLAGADKDNYELAASGQQTGTTVTIGKANHTFTAPRALNPVYNGSEQVLALAGSLGTTGSGTVQYKLGENGIYADTVPVAVNAGTYTVYYRVIGDSNHADSDEDSIEVILSPLDVTGGTAAAFRSMTYTGSAQSPSAAVTVGTLTATGAWSSVTNTSDKTTFTAVGNFTGKIENLSTGMLKASVNAPAVASKVYDGSLQKAEVPASELYTVTANNGGTEVGSYDVELTLTDSANYKWSDSEDTAKTVKFEITAQPKYTVYGYSDAIGNIVTADYQNAEKDVKITLTVTPAEEYSLQTLSVTNVSGAAVTLAVDNTFIMPETDVTVTAVFTKNTYEITGYSDAEGNAVTADVRSAAKGDKVTLTVLPADNYGLSSLTVTDASGATVPVADDMTFTMPASAVTVNAEFEPGVFGITGYSDIYGNSVTADVKSAAKGENVKLTVSPANGCYVRNVNVTDENGNPVAVAGDSTFVMPAAKVTVSADFAVITYEIITYSDNNGNFVASNMVIAQPGNKVTLTVKTAEGFELKSLTVADAFGNSVTLSGDCSFVMPSSKATVHAVFEEEKPDDIIPEDPDTDPVKPDTDLEKTDTEQEAVLEIETDLTSSSDSDALVKMIEESDAKKIVLNTSEKSVTEQGLENKKTAEAAGERITEVTKEQDSKSVVIDEDVLAAIADAGDIESLEINTSVVDLEFDAKSIESINKQKNGDIKIIVKLLKEEIAENENESTKAYFEISMLNGDGTPITEFDGGEVKITMPIPASMQGKELVCVYTDGNGHYSPVDGKIQKNGTFCSFTTHFSEYILMTKEEAEELYNCIYDYLTLQVKATECTADSVKLDWNRYDDAEGYIVYGSLCNGNGKKYKLKKLAVINDPETTEFTVTGLEEGRHYKFRVKAFKVVNGKKYVTVKTYLVHATTAGGKCKTTAAVDIDQTGMKKANALTLKAGMTYDINAVRYDAKGSKVRHSSIKYESANPEVATVSLKTGKITAVGKGKCSVFVIAENGLCEEIKVTVK